MKTWTRWVVLLLTLMLLFPGFAWAEGEEEEANATDLSTAILFENCGHYDLKGKIIGPTLTRAEEWEPYEEFFINLKAGVDAHWFCIQWNKTPEDVEIRQLDENGAVLSKTIVPEEYDLLLELEPGTVRIGFYAGKYGMAIARLALYSKGKLPTPFYSWQHHTGHLDYLIVSTHPDDDVIFMGGVIPLYGREQGRVGTVAYVTTPSRIRVDEAIQGAWTMGAEVIPFFLGFHDLNTQRMTEFANKFRQESVTLALVRLFRQQRPLVVFSHDVNGEYGHWQHIIVSAAVVEACKLAADASYDPSSAAAYGTWEVKKCYLHLYPENTLVMDVNTPLASMDNKTVIQIAQAAFLKHRTQQNGRHWVQTDKDAHPLSQFGMAYGTVDAGQDVFDNIDPSLFVANLDE